MDKRCPVCGEAMMSTKLTGMLRCNNPVCGDMHVLIPADYETYADRLAARVAELEDRIDLMIDEFMRIKSCPGCTSEIKGLCDRAEKDIKQHVHVIVQRDEFEAKGIAMMVLCEDLKAENARLKAEYDKMKRAWMACSAELVATKKGADNA